jgi:acyl-CoA synthetase (AMP-forming)/AMP-acid ligase II
LLIKAGLKKGTSAVIGNNANIEQLALVFACSELGIEIVIIPNPMPAKNHNITSNVGQYKGMINPKVALMMPIDLFISCERDDTDKAAIFNDICRFSIAISEHDLDYTTNDIIRADENSIFLKCTSSGTTDTPKVIKHTHGFMHDLIMRNSRQFYGAMAMLNNLAHGSSPATYFLPGMVSNQVTDHYNFANTHPVQVAEIAHELQLTINHMLVSYTMYIDEFFESNVSLKDCVIHTLGLIRKDWADKIKEKNKAKDVISIFGTNETSGPLMINQATDIDFTEDTYKVLDDFYKLEIDKDKCLIATVPFYNKQVNTMDTFLKRGDKYVHVGRSNLFRINDLDIDVGKYQLEVDKLMKADLVIDVKKDNIYLAIWDNDFDHNKVNKINDLMKNDSNGLHHISKYSNLVYTDFLSGIKLDKEMLREYFRTQ